LGAVTGSSIVLNTAVAHWFKRKIGLALGFASSGIGMGGLLVPIIAWLINQFDWRMTMFILGIGNLLIIPAMALVIRHRPEQYGYLPDGVPPSPATEAKQKVKEVETASSSQELRRRASQALRSPTYLLLIAALSLEFLVLLAVVVHVVPYLSSVNLAESRGVWIATFLPILSIGGRLGFGWIGDKFIKKWVLAFTLVAQVIGLLAFLYAPALWSLITFVITFGVGYGGSIAVTPALIRDHFGPSVFGSLSGVSYAVTGLVGLAGPVFAGWVFDTRGSYDLVWISLATVMAIAIAPILCIKKKEAN
jgi:MFS family permease